MGNCWMLKVPQIYQGHSYLVGGKKSWNKFAWFGMTVCFKGTIAFVCVHQYLTLKTRPSWTKWDQDDQSKHVWKQSLCHSRMF